MKLKKKQKWILYPSLIFLTIFLTIIIVLFSPLSPFMIYFGNGGAVGPTEYDILPSVPILNDIQPDPDNDGEIALDWEPSTSVQYYNVYRRKSGSPEVQIAIGRTDNSFVDIAEKEDGLYYYKIEAVNNIGKVQSDEQSVRVDIEFVPNDNDGIPDAPILDPIIPSISTDGEICLDWNKVSGADRYAVYRSTDNWYSIDFFKSDISENYYDEIVSDGSYSYKVKAINIDDEGSEYSNEETVIVQIPGVPDSPEAYEITYEIVDSRVEIIVSWSEIDCDSYNLYKNSLNEGLVLIAEGLTSTSYSDVLTGKGLYIYKVSAVNEVGESELSNLSSINLGEDGLPTEDYTVIIVVVVILGALAITIAILLKRKSKKR